jgi:D-sedoheptulose 7-phosphate isomerase
MKSEYTDRYLEETKKIADTIDRPKIDMAIQVFRRLKENNGRLFILGVGGSAGSASHAVNDFRKIAGIETYSPVDNVSELTARANDCGFETIFIEWLKVSRLSRNDVILVLSVSGGTEKASKNLVLAMEHAKSVGAGIVSIVSRDGGAALKLSDICIHVPVVDQGRITPHAESWHGLLLHLMVNAINES